MDVNVYSYPPGDPQLIDKICHEFLSQGRFDRLRKECLANADTKPAYQNLQQRVENTVSQFLKKQTWKPDLNKNQLRDSVRKHILESGFLDAGINRILDQVVNPHVLSTVFLPEVEEVVYSYLSIPRPVDKQPKRTISSFSDLDDNPPGVVETNDIKTENEIDLRNVNVDSSRSEFKDAVKAEKEDDKDDVRNLSNISDGDFKKMNDSTESLFEKISNESLVSEEKSDIGLSESKEKILDEEYPPGTEPTYKVEPPSDDSQESLSRMGVERLQIIENDLTNGQDSDANAPLEIDERTMSDSQDSDDSILKQMSPISQGRLTPDRELNLELEPGPEPETESTPPPPPTQSRLPILEEKNPLTFVGRIPKLKREDDSSNSSKKEETKVEKLDAKSVYSSDESESSKQSANKSDSDKKSEEKKDEKSSKDKFKDEKKSSDKSRRKDEKSSSSRDKRERSRDRKSKDDKSSSRKDSKEKEKEKDRRSDKSSSSNDKKSSSSSHRSSSSHKSRHRDDSRSRDKDKSRHDKKDRDRKSDDKKKREDDKKKKSKSVDDHSKERKKREDRRSTDRDSNERERDKSSNASRSQGESSKRKEKEAKSDGGSKEKEQKGESDKKEEKEVEIEVKKEKLSNKKEVFEVKKQEEVEEQEVKMEVPVQEVKLEEQEQRQVEVREEVKTEVQEEVHEQMEMEVQEQVAEEVKTELKEKGNPEVQVEEKENKSEFLQVEERILPLEEDSQTIRFKDLLNQGAIKLHDFKEPTSDFYQKFNSTGFRYFEDWEMACFDEIESEFKEFINVAENNLSALSDDESDNESEFSFDEVNRTIIKNSVNGLGNFETSLMFNPHVGEFYKWVNKDAFEKFEKQNKIPLVVEKSLPVKLDTPKIEEDDEAQSIEEKNKENQEQDIKKTFQQRKVRSDKPKKPLAETIPHSEKSDSEELIENTQSSVIKILTEYEPDEKGKIPVETVNEIVYKSKIEKDSPGKLITKSVHEENRVDLDITLKKTEEPDVKLQSALEEDKRKESSVPDVKEELLIHDEVEKKMLEIMGEDAMNTSVPEENSSSDFAIPETPSSLPENDKLDLSNKEAPKIDTDAKIGLLAVQSQRRLTDSNQSKKGRISARLSSTKSEECSDHSDHGEDSSVDRTEHHDLEESVKEDENKKTDEELFSQPEPTKGYLGKRKMSQDSKTAENEVSKSSAKRKSVDNVKQTKKPSIRVGLPRPRSKSLKVDGNAHDAVVNKFNLPLSPESDDAVLNDKSPAVVAPSPVVNKRKRAPFTTQNVGAIPTKKAMDAGKRRTMQQKYDSQDLYKPRPILTGSRTRNRNSGISERITSSKSTPGESNP